MKGMAEPVEHIDGLTSLEKRTFQFIFRTFGHSTFLLEEFLNKVPLEHIQAEWHFGLVLLCRRQIVSVKRKSWGERLFHVPVSLYFRIFNELYAPLHSTADDIDDEEATGEASMSMAQTALLLMLELEREPLFFTRKGQLQKNSRDRMLRVFTQKEQEAGTNGRLPCFVEESLDLMLRMGIVKIEDGMTAVQRSKYMSWLEMNGTEREEIMFMIWYRVHGPLDARLQWLTAALWQAPAGKWVAMEHVLHRMREAGLSIAFEQVEKWLKRLQIAGWIDTGIDMLGRRIIRRTVREIEEQRTLSVQPDLEIIAFPGTAFPVLRKLHQLAESFRADVAIRVRLGKQSCLRAFARGFAAAEVIAFLQQHAVVEVPNQVKDALAVWEKDNSSIQLIKGVLLHTESDAAAFAIETCFAKYRLRQFTPHDWLVEGLDEQAIGKLLKQQGLYVMQEDTVCDGVMEGEPAQQTDAHDHEMAKRIDFVQEALRPDAPGFYKPSDISVLYQSDHEDLSEEEVYPDHEQIPAMWYKQYRKYHASTVKQLIEQAIEWRTGLRIRAGDREMVFAPRSIDDAMQPCVVDGYNGRERVRLHLHTIEQIKLLLPGILD